MNTAPVPLSAREKQVPVDMIGRYRFRRLLLRNERFLLRLFQQLQFAMRQLIYAICHLRHFFIMGDEDDGLAFIRALPHQPPYDGLVLLIERCGDLIPKDDLPICGQRAEHSETLSFSAGEQTDTLLSFPISPAIRSNSSARLSASSSRR